MLPCLNNSFCILYIFHCPSKLLWRWMLCLSLCQGRENMIGSWEFCIIGSSWSCNPSLAEETWCVRWEYWYNVFFFSRRFKREGVKHRGIRSQNTQHQRNKFMAAVVLKASSGKSGVSLFDDEPMSVWVPSILQTCELWGVGMFWICCVKKRTWRAKRGYCLSLMDDVSTVERMWNTDESSHCHCNKKANFST